MTTTNVDPAERPRGSWIVRPALGLSVVCLGMAAFSAIRGMLANSFPPGYPWNACAFFGMSMLFFAQAGSIRRQRYAHAIMVVGATTAAFFAWTWLTELAAAAAEVPVAD